MEYKAGDTLYLQTARGWNGRAVKEYKVIRVTPKGQIVASANDVEIRVSPNGRLVGEKYGYHRVVDAAEAAGIRAEVRTDNIWMLAFNELQKLEKAIRQQDLLGAKASLEYITRQVNEVEA